MDIQGRVMSHIQSLFAEEYRGDLRKAYEEIERYKVDEITSSDGPDYDPEKTACFLRSSIWVYVLLGRFGDAYCALAQLKTLVDTSDSSSNNGNRLTANWGLRYSALKAYVDYNRRYPPCIPYQHEMMMPVNLSMIGDIAGPTDIILELNENTKKFFRPDDTSASANRDVGICFVTQILVNLPLRRRDLTATRHPLSPNGTWKVGQDGKSSEQAIAEVSPQLLQLVQKNTIKAPETLEKTDLYLQRLVVDLHYAMDSPGTEKALKELYDLYEKLNDKAGMANCRLLQADGLLSPPFASPVTQNLIVVHPSVASGESTLWDPIEGKNPLKENDQANKCYEESLELFRQANCPRGQAAVLLRQGSVLHARTCSLSPDSPEKWKLLDQATKKYDEALGLLDIEEANTQIIKTNHILLEISKGKVSSRDLKNRAGEIGKWGREHKNELLSSHLCTLMLRFARREWERYTSFDTANLCYECAHACATQLGAVVPAFVSMYARAEVHYEMYDSTAAIVVAEQCVQKFDTVLKYYDGLINTTKDTPMGKIDRQHLIMRKFDFLWSFGRSVGSIYALTDALDRFKSWEERFLSYLEEDTNVRQRDEWIKYSNTGAGLSVKELWGATLEEVLDESSLDRVISRKYRNSEIMNSRSMQEGNLHKAEAAIHRFLEDSAKFKRIYTREMFQMLAYNRLGDTKRIKDILDSMTDDELFHNSLEDLYKKGFQFQSLFSSLSLNAIFACVMAEDWKRGSRILDILLEIDPDFLSESSFTDSVANLPFRLATAGFIYLNNAQSELAFQTLLKTRRIVETRRSKASDIDAKVSALSAARPVEAFLVLAELCLRCSAVDLPVGILNSYEHGHPSRATWEEHALLFLEEARARSLLDTLVSSAQNQSDELGRQMSDRVYKRRALTYLQFLSKRTAQQEKEMADLAAEIEGLDVGDFSSSTSDLINTLNSSISPHSLFSHLNDDVIVIEGAFYRSGCVLLGVTNNGVEAFQKGTTRLIDLRRWVMELMQVMRMMTGTHSGDEQNRKARVEALSSQISGVLLTPFAEIIRRKRHVIFSISEPLSAFPFSVLVFDGKPLIMHAAVSQIPSLTVHYHLSKRPSESSAPTVSVFTKALSQDDNATDAQDTKEASLPMAGIEAVNISNMFSTWPIDASTLTRAQFRNYIQDYTSVLHIGTHGMINFENPLLSSISIGEDFRVLDMSQIQSKANLLVFAACLSGLGRTTIGNDVLGFTHVVLGTGCQAYIGTLFEVSDFASMVLMTLFYRNIKNEPTLSLAEALRLAQIEFLQFDTAKATKFIDNLLDMWNVTAATPAAAAAAAGENEPRNPSDIVPEGKYLLRLQKLLLPQLDWTSPFFWAPFVLMGYGDFCFCPDPGKEEFLEQLTSSPKLVPQGCDE